MSSGGSIQAMITAMKNNASQRKLRTKFKGMEGSNEGVYSGKIKEREFSPEEIEATKEAFQLQMKAERKKTYVTILITAIVVPLIIYAIIQLYLMAFV